VPVLENLLADLASGDEARAEAAASSLAALGDAAIPSLRGLLDSPDADLRWWATRTLASLPGLDVGLLLLSLADAAPEVRQCAALGLCSHPSEDAIQPLIHLLSDADFLAADLAAKALTVVGEPAVERVCSKCWKTRLSRPASTPCRPCPKLRTRAPSRPCCPLCLKIRPYSITGQRPDWSGWA
jgi:hypothetical protein